MLRWLFEQLETSPGQERVITEAASEVFDALRAARGEARTTREDLARVIAGESFDESTLGGVFARHDEAIAKLRGVVTVALGKVHGALDEGQRKRFAEIVAQGPFRPFGGPYRT